MVNIWEFHKKKDNAQSFEIPIFGSPCIGVMGAERGDTHTRPCPQSTQTRDAEQRTFEGAWGAGFMCSLLGGENDVGGNQDPIMNERGKRKR